MALSEAEYALGGSEAGDGIIKRVLCFWPMQGFDSSHPHGCGRRTRSPFKAHVAHATYQINYDKNIKS